MKERRMEERRRFCFGVWSNMGFWLKVILLVRLPEEKVIEKVREERERGFLW